MAASGVPDAARASIGVIGSTMLGKVWEGAAPAMLPVLLIIIVDVIIFDRNT